MIPKADNEHIAAKKSFYPIRFLLVGL